jgi:hypothetical protein
LSPTHFPTSIFLLIKSGLSLETCLFFYFKNI